jgi:ribosomal protein S18 acetylase RimI-like enzyme
MVEPDIEIDEATVADAAEILALQRLAFQAEGRLYDEWSLPPLREDLADLTEHIRTNVVLKAVLKSKIVGAVRGRQQMQTCTIERLAVLPALQRRGIGTRLMAAIEARFAHVERFELYSGHLSRGNLQLYGRLGYQVTRTQRWSTKVTLVFMGKRAPGPEPGAA